jgi:ABC-type nitrate/sulfonate/bicarbonate transport system substrate-binding protein
MEFFISANSGGANRAIKRSEQDPVIHLLNKPVMTNLTVALDWTPNVNHIGFFVAQQLGFYAEHNLELIFINPATDNYETTPGKKLESGTADFAIAPFETVISLNNKENKVDAIAVFAILQEDLSSIATLQSSNLHRPRLLDGKTYASYKARYEDYIVQEMIKNDGGMGNLTLVYPPKLGIWNTLLQNEADATWIFDNWEGIAAEKANIALHKFKLGQYQIPYGYSPVVITTNSKLAAHRERYAGFIKATRKGYLYAAAHKSEAAETLMPYLTDDDRENIDINKALDITAPFFGSETTCGYMEPQRISRFLNWLADNQLENSRITTQTLFTNELLS